MNRLKRTQSIVFVKHRKYMLWLSSTFLLQIYIWYLQYKHKKDNYLNFSINNNIYLR